MLKVCLVRNVSAILLRQMQKHLKSKKDHSSSAFGFFRIQCYLNLVLRVFQPAAMMKVDLVVSFIPFSTHFSRFC